MTGFEKKPVILLYQKAVPEKGDIGMVLYKGKNTDGHFLVSDHFDRRNHIVIGQKKHNSRQN